MDHTSTPSSTQYDCVFRDNSASLAAADAEELLGGPFEDVVASKNARKRLNISSPNDTVIARPSKNLIMRTLIN